MSDPVHLDLPEPGRSLFIRVADVLERKLPAIMPAGANWQLGGGTVLAAQWGHRLSTDVDIMLPHASNFSAYMPGRDDSLTDEMERLGATRLDVPANTLKYTFPNGRVELTAMDSTPAVPSRTAHVEGRTIRILPNVCILGGKLAGRGAMLPARDVFDICVAADLDPQALRGAVNHIHGQTLAEVVATLRDTASEYPNIARNAILQPAPRWKPIIRTGAQVAIEAIENSMYVGHDVDFKSGAAHVTIETKGGHRETRSFRTGLDLAHGLLSMGLEHRAFGQHKTVGQFAEFAETEIAESRRDE